MMLRGGVGIPEGLDVEIDPGVDGGMWGRRGFAAGLGGGVVAGINPPEAIGGELDEDVGGGMDWLLEAQVVESNRPQTITMSNIRYWL
jgi:hypothetical protein